MDIRTREAVRYLGYGTSVPDDSTLQRIKESFVELEKLADKKSIYCMFELKTEDNGTIAVGNVEVYSKNLQTNLKDCEKVILFAATLGLDVDRQIRKYQLVDMSKALVMQACATTILEEYCNQIQKMLAEQLQMEGKYIRPRFSPGYGDFSILHQKDVLTMLDASKKIGIAMTENYMLIPTKSVTALIGVGDVATSCNLDGCEACDKRDCTYRRS